MSRTTEAFIEAMSEHYQAYTSNVSFLCPLCKKVSNTEVAVPEPDYSAEKMSDMTSDDAVYVSCSDCDAEFDGYAYASPSHCSIELTEYPEVTVHADIPFYEQPYDYEDYELPEDPFQIFMTTTQELKLIIKEHAKPDAKSLMNRMVFSQVIAAFEAYFCDTLIHETTKNDENMRKIISSDGQLSKKTYKLDSLLQGSNLAKKEIEISLKNRLYHKIDEVVRVYQNSLSIKIQPDRVALEKMKAAVSQRHDCIHRNGMDKDGNKLDVFTPEYVDEIISLAESFVQHTQNQIDSAISF